MIILIVSAKRLKNETVMKNGFCRKNGNWEIPRELPENFGMVAV
jgi:hypothetical protein